MNKSMVIKLAMLVLIIALFSSIFCYSQSYAMGEIISGGKGFLFAGEDPSGVIDTSQLKTTSDYIYNILLAIAIAVAVIVAMVLGIQFMVASADEKAKVKEALMPFVVGCIVVFGSFTIWKVVVDVGNSTEGNKQEYMEHMEQLKSQLVTDIAIKGLEEGTTNYQEVYDNMELSDEQKDTVRKLKQAGISAIDILGYLVYL